MNILRKRMVMEELELEDEVLDTVDQLDDEDKEEATDFDLASDTAIKPEAEGTEGI